MRWLDQLRQRHAERRAWAQARTLDDLGELTARWLAGDVDYQAGYYGPVDVDEDVAPGMRDTLLRLNRAGLVTTGSQAGWADPGAPQSGFTSGAAVEGFAQPATTETLLRAVAGTGHQVAVNDRDGVAVSRLDGRPYTRFGRRLSRRGVASHIYPGCHRDAVRSAAGADQVVIWDPQIGRNTLWAALDEAATQLELEKTMSSQEDLTTAQARLYNEVLNIARDNGEATRTVLARLDAPAADKAAVAGILARAEAGDELAADAAVDDAPQVAQSASPRSGTYSMAGDGSSTGHAGTNSSSAASGTDNSSSTGRTGATVGAHAGAGQTVNVPGSAVGSSHAGSARGGWTKTSTAGSDSGANIGAVVSSGGQVNAGNDICGVKNVSVPKPRAQRESGNVAEA